MGRLDDLDLSPDLPKKEAKKRLKKAQKRMQELRLELAGLDGDPRLGPPLCVVLEGWDASGKGGAIKRLVGASSTRATCASSSTRRRRPTSCATTGCWRFWPALPGWGGMAILDRSWYGRVLVERVEGFATEDGVEARLRRDQRLRGDARATRATVLVKLWLHISDEEQLARFEARQEDPLKAYKLTDEDWRNRGKRPAYEEAIEDMLERTVDRVGAVAPRRGRLQALRPREGDRDGDRGGRAGLERHGRQPPP